MTGNPADSGGMNFYISNGILPNDCLACRAVTYWPIISSEKLG